MNFKNFGPKGKVLMFKGGTLFGVGHYSRLGHYSNNHDNKSIHRISRLKCFQKESQIIWGLFIKLQFF